MSDSSLPNAEEQQQQQLFTEEQVNAIIEQVTKRVRETQLAEYEQRSQGSPIPEEIQVELDSYQPSQLQRALQRFKKAVPKYNNERWNTPEEANPNFVSQLKKWKFEGLQHVNTIYRLTEARGFKREQQQRLTNNYNMFVVNGDNKRYNGTGTKE